MVHVKRLKDPLCHELFISLSGGRVYNFADQAICHILIAVYSAYFIDHVHVTKLQEHAVEVLAFLDQVRVSMIGEPYSVRKDMLEVEFFSLLPGFKFEIRHILNDLVIP